MSLPKAREWIVSAARANYQELSKLAKDENKLVRLQVSSLVCHSVIIRSLGYQREPKYEINLIIHDPKLNCSFFRS